MVLGNTYSVDEEIVPVVTSTPDIIEEVEVYTSDEPVLTSNGLEGVIELSVKATEQPTVSAMPITDEVELLAQLLHCEGGVCDSREELYRIGSVVMNRINSPRFPNTLFGVIYEDGQYGSTSKLYTEQVTEMEYEVALDIWYNGTNVFPSDVVFQTGFKPSSYGRMEYISEWHYYYTSIYGNE